MFTFEKNVPIPEQAKPVDIDGWKVGESFLVTSEKLKERVRNRSNRLGYKVSFRKTTPTTWRCWRVA